MHRAKQDSGADVDELVRRARSGDRGALARLLSRIERGQDSGAAMPMPSSEPRGSTCDPILTAGITGAPGAGKSTLLGALLAHAARLNAKTAALAIDPSSPISGGALLGDRVRMQAVATDPLVFVRSMASRGRVGGLSDMTRASVRCLHACGWPRVFIETVGIGQVDVDVATVADVVIVVLNPGAGDEIQAFKAGLMEIADIFVINKADHPGTQALRHDLEGLITALPAGQARPGVIETVATNGQGVDTLWNAVAENFRQAEQSGELQRRRNRRIALELVEVAQAMLKRRLDAASHTAAFADIQAAVSSGGLSMREAASRLLRAIQTEQQP
jgi:LAO/AO transport system kinase